MKNMKMVCLQTKLNDVSDKGSQVEKSKKKEEGKDKSEEVEEENDKDNGDDKKGADSSSFLCL